MDVNYCEKIQNEKDFEKVRSYINYLFAELRDKQGEKARGQYTILRTKQDAVNDLINEIRNETWPIGIDELTQKRCNEWVRIFEESSLRRIEYLIQRNSYRDYLEACTLLDKLSIAQKKLCHGIEKRIRELLEHTMCNIETINHGTNDQINSSLKKIKKVWYIGIPISLFILPGLGALSGTPGLALVLGIILTTVVYFSLSNKFQSEVKASIGTSTKHLQVILNKLRRMQQDIMVIIRG